MIAVRMKATNCEKMAKSETIQAFPNNYSSSLISLLGQLRL
jgi:hypothetical protein